MIKTWVNKALILAYMTLFCFLGISTRVDAERLYILDNLVTNGNFEIDTNNNGIADGFTLANATGEIIDGWQVITSTGSTVYFQLNYYTTFIDGHEYYVTFDYQYLSGNYLPYTLLSFIYEPNQVIYSQDNLINLDIQNVKFNFTASGNKTSFHIFTAYSVLTSGLKYRIDNLMIFDLTGIFGFGYEPSLQDFELYYLPDLDYFDTYNSFEPDMTTSISDISYSNLNENLKVIDYTKSIIDNDGRNIDLDLSLYFYDINNISGYIQASYYKENNHPTMKYNGVEYVLNWVYSDYSQRVLILDLTDEEELILKKILFNRYIDRGEEYFNLKAETTVYTAAKMWFTIGSKFDLLVDVKSFLLSRETITENDFNIVNEMYIKTYDQSDNLLLPSLKLNIGDLFRTIYVGDFGSQYTNISKFNFEFLLTSPDWSIFEPHNEENHYFYEIGIFSSDKVLHPSYIESDIDSLWDMRTCDWYQIGCHLSNFANDALTTTYNKLNIDAIIAFFDGTIDDVTQVVDTAPSGVKTVFTVLFAGLGVALIIVIIEKMNR